MNKYHVYLTSPIHKGFRCTKAANSLDINLAEKTKHELTVNADIEKPYNVGLIVGGSGSGKTTLAQQIWGQDCFKSHLVEDVPVIEQLPKNYTYDECAKILCGVGLTSVPCWVRPVYTLSNGQKARARIAVDKAHNPNLLVVDEWTSVVDRTCAKIMSHCVQKFVRRNKKRIVLLSCHYDVIEWLDPDWIIDCNSQSYTDRRCHRRGQRKEQLKFDLKQSTRAAWKGFSKYHYLSKEFPGGHSEIFGLFYKSNQIGFACFTNYVPWGDKTKPKMMHTNRVVVHPDYVGFGLGIKFVNECARIMTQQGYRVRTKLSSLPLVKAKLKQPDKWRLMKKGVAYKQPSTESVKNNKLGDRLKVVTYSFKWTGGC